MSEQDINSEDPISSMDGVAIELHEMFLALKRAGFPHSDALQIIAHAVSDGVMLPMYTSVAFDPRDIDEDYNDDDDGDTFLG